MSERDRWNACRYDPAAEDGHYESYFLRANHRGRPLGFWIRYTIFSPKGSPGQAVGELWCIYFDGESGAICAVKRVLPIAQCSFSNERLEVSIGPATLDDESLEGQAASSGHSLAWMLAYSGGDAPLLLLPESYYERGFPKAKALVGRPNAVFEGSLVVDGERVPVEGWQGSQNHNWGSQHTDRYAWGQVAGFDEDGEAFLECSMAKVKVGPFWTPWLTLLVLRLDGQEFALNSMRQALRAKGRLSNLDWSFESRGGGISIKGRISAAKESFVGLRYDNPPGGFKTCLNSKLGNCTLIVEREGRPANILHSRQRAAFEILDDDPGQDVPILA